jgi:hypothetical protein
VDNANLGYKLVEDNKIRENYKRNEGREICAPEINLG